MLRSFIVLGTLIAIGLVLFSWASPSSQMAFAQEPTPEPVPLETEPQLPLEQPQPQPQPQPEPQQRCFPETGYCISGRIAEFWEQNGGLPVFGFPISPQQQERIEDRDLQVQWFERTRMELHPENAPPYDVLLGPLGVQLTRMYGNQWSPGLREEPQDDCLFFSETGYNVCGEILDAWRANGLEIDGQAGTSYQESLALLGMPISNARWETLGDGNAYKVQWFERARIELHPENERPYDVLFGMLPLEIFQWLSAIDGGGGYDD